MGVIRQILSFILPVTVLVIIPLRIESTWTIRLGWNSVLGITLMATGLIVMSITIASFIRIGKGTLAPWSPTKKLVIAGLYRYVRNPMILGVLTILLGEASAFWSVVLLKWAAAFFVINTIYFIIYEEPGLEERFGKEYSDYKNKVSRWIPRFTPFDPTAERK